MISVKFLLKEPSKDNSLIYMFVFYGQKKPIKLSTSEIIPVQFWNKETQRVREVREFQSAKAVNRKLDRYKRFIESYFDSTESTPTPQQVREAFNIFLGKDTKKADKDIFVNFFSSYLDDNKTKPNIKAYTSTYNNIKELMPENVKISQIDYEYLETFERLFLEKTIKRGQSKGGKPSMNYLSLQVKNIKAVLNNARKKGIATSATLKDFTKKTEEADAVYLTPEELLKIRNATLSKKLAKARALFLVGCYTAMRVSDYKRLKKENIRDGFFYMITKKTGFRLVVPIHPVIDEILREYDYELPKLSDQKLNDAIKKVAEEAGINDTIITKRTEGGKSIERTFKKWQLITTHTARRTGATNMYLAGISTLAIMMITGHRTERAFLRYIRVSKEQNAELLAKHAYFTGGEPSPSLT